MGNNNSIYLGDGVYASYDGYHINLAVNHHTNNVVALDPEVFKALIDYNNMLIRTSGGKNNNTLQQ
jgi:hypothetical protein